MNTSHHVFTPDLNREYITIVRGEGVCLYDDRGKRYIDASAGPFACSLGYGRKDMAAALADQAETLHFSYRYYSLHPALTEAARMLHELTGYEKFMFHAGGSEANEEAVKITRLYQIARGNKRKHKIIGRWMSYHGGTMYTISVGACLGTRLPYDDYTTDAGHIPPTFCYRCPYGKTPETCDVQCARALEDEILRQGPDTVAGFMAETVSGSSLSAYYPKRREYYRIVQEICRKYDVLLILDEVLVGSGRTGKFLACDHFDVRPDLLILAKGISGAYIPASVVGCTTEVVRTIADGAKKDHIGLAYTSTNQPMIARSIVEALRIMKAEKLVERAAENGAYMLTKFEELRFRHPVIGDIRGLGLYVGIEFVKDRGTKELLPPEMSFAKQLSAEAERKGLIAFHFAQQDYSAILRHELLEGRYREAGVADLKIGDSVVFGPPLVVSKGEIDEIVDIYDRTLTQVEQRNGL